MTMICKNCFMISWNKKVVDEREGLEEFGLAGIISIFRMEKDGHVFSFWLTDINSCMDLCVTGIEQVISMETVA